MRRIQSVRPTMTAAAMAAIFLAVSSAVSRADSEWKGGSGDFLTGSNWTSGLDTSLLLDTGTATLAGSYGPTSPALYLRLGERNGTNGTLSLISGANLSAKRIDVGSGGGVGTVLQSGGTVSADTVYIGWANTSTGHYTLSGGSLSANSLTTQSGTGDFWIQSGTANIGWLSPKSFTQSGGAYTGDDLNLSASNQFATFSGGTASIKRAQIGNYGGAINVAGGNVTINELVVNSDNSGVNVRSGQLQTDVLWLSSTGKFVQSGGTLQVSGGIINSSTTPISFSASAALSMPTSGIADLSKAGGLSSLAVTTGSESLLILPTGVTKAGLGSYTGTGTVISKGDALTIAAGRTIRGLGTLNMPLTLSGNLAKLSSTSTATLNVTGAGFTMQGAATATLDQLSTNAMTDQISGTSTLAANYIFVATTADSWLLQSGGTVTASGALNVGTGSKAGTYQLSSGTVTAAALTVGNNGLFTQTAGAVSTGVLDVKAGRSYQLFGGSLTLTGGSKLAGALQGPVGGGAPDLKLEPSASAGSTIYDFETTNLSYTAAINLHSTTNALVLLPSFNPAAPLFTSAPDNSGIIHYKGTPLNIPAGQSVRGDLTTSDPVTITGSLAGGGFICSSTLALQGSGTLDAAVKLSGTRAIEAIGGGSLAATATMAARDLKFGGSFTQSGGESRFFKTMQIGNARDRRADYTLSAGLLTLTNEVLSANDAYTLPILSVAGAVGGAASTFVQTGGTININRVNPQSAYQIGHVVVGGDNFAQAYPTTPGTTAGHLETSGTGIFTAGRMYVGTQGVVQHSGGTTTLVATTYSATPTIPDDNGYAWASTLGSVPSLHVRGQYNLSGGSLNTGYEVIEGTFTQTGGTHTAAGILLKSGGYFEARSGVVDLRGSGNATDGNGWFTVNGHLDLTGPHSEDRLIATTLSVGSTGSITGTGRIRSTLRNAGLLSPGHSPGDLDIVGDFIQTPEGILRLEINGTDDASQDHLTITGNANLAGEIQLVLGPGFTPAPGMQFSLLSVGGNWTGTPTVTLLNAPADYTTSAAFNSSSRGYAITLIPEPTLAGIAATVIFSSLASRRRGRRGPQEATGSPWK